jgi:hypothetical protein
MAARNTDNVLKTDVATTNKPATAVEPVAAKPQSKFAGLRQKYLAKKKLAIPLSVIIILAIILGIPSSRYLLLGSVVKEAYTITVTDDITHKPVSSATITLYGKMATTDKNGKVKLRVRVGPTALSITKKYYQTANLKITVAFPDHDNSTQTELHATGRQVPISLTNKISGTALENVTVKAAGTEVKTDKNGTATIVLPTDQSSISAGLSADGYNNAKVTITVTDQVSTGNDFQMVPSGKLYFLSKLSGKIDVVKTDLDGDNRQTVLAGTGQEDDLNTVLLASRDWKYLLLESRRDTDKAKLYVIDTSTDKLNLVEQGNTIFTLTGWSGHNFVYTAHQGDIQNWQPKQEALKSYGADSRQVTTLDETKAAGTGQYSYATETFSNVFALPAAIVYTKSWDAYYVSTALLADKQATINMVQPDGGKRTAVKSFGLPVGTVSSEIGLNARLYEPGAIYFQFNEGNSFYKYEKGQIAETTEVNQNNFYSGNYITYLISPSGDQTFWSEARDGKNTLFIGDQDGQNGKQIETLSTTSQYGWYSDDYLLESKNASELYIVARAGFKPPLKVSDYHKPSQSFSGYGGGYGGY